MNFLRKSDLLFCIFLLNFCFCFSQSLVIKDANENKPISNVTIYNSDQSLSIISTSNGKVNLSQFNSTDTLFFSHISYEKFQIAYNKLSDLKNGSTIFLNPKTQLLSEIILSVGRSKENKDKISKKVSLITKEELFLESPTTSADLLINGGGVRIQKTQGGGGSPVIRGFEANRVLIVVDGVRMNNAIYRSGHLQNAITVDPKILERTEIIFGPSSVAYGSDALGGVVHFYSRLPKINNENKILAEINQSYNLTFNSRTRSANLELSNKKWASFSNISYSNFGDISMGKKRKHGFSDWGLNKFYLNRGEFNSGNLINNNPNVQKNTSYSQLDVMQKFNFKISDFENLILNFQYSKSSNIDRYDKLNEFSNQENLKYSDWYYGPQKRTLISSTYNFSKNKKWLKKGTIVAAFQNINESRFNRRFQSLNLNSQYENVKVYSINSDLYTDISDSSKLSYGFEFTHNNIDSDAHALILKRNGSVLISEPNDTNKLKIPTRYPSAGSNYTSAAAYYEFKRDLSIKSNLNFGMRFTNTWLKGNWKEESLIDAQLNKISSKNSSLTGSFGYVYRSEKNWQISTNFSSGFRSPNIDDMGKIRENRGLLSVPNKNLKPEYAYNTELSLTKFLKNKKNVVSVNFYYTHITNHIIRDNFEVLNDFSTQDPYTILYDSEEVKTIANINFGRAYIYGGSFDSQFKIIEKLFLTSNLTYTNGGSVKNRYNLPSISPLFGRFDLKWVQSNLKSQFSFRFSDSKNRTEYSSGGEDGLEETPFLGYNEDGKVYNGSPSWGVFKFSTSYQFSNKIRAALIVDNIFDIHYREFASGISSPGRNFNFVLETKF